MLKRLGSKQIKKPNFGGTKRTFWKNIQNKGSKQTFVENFRGTTMKLNDQVNELCKKLSGGFEEWWAERLKRVLRLVFHR